MDKKTQLIEKSLKLSRALALSSLFFPLLTAVGWILDLPYLTSGHPALPAMQPNTAVVLTISALVVLLSRPTRQNPMRKTLANLLSAAVLLFGLLNLSQYIFDWDLGIDRLLLGDIEPSELLPFPGRPSPQTSVNFMLMGLASLLSNLRLVPSYSQILWLAMGANAVIAATGYIFSTSQFYGFPIYEPAIGMAVHTALGFILLAVASLCAHPTQGLMTLIVSETRSGQIACQIIKAGILAPPAVGFGTRLGVATGPYDVSVQVSLFAVIIIGLILRITWYTARQAEAEELRANAVLQQVRLAQERFELALRGADLGAWDWNVQTGEVTFNSRWAEMRGYRLEEIRPHVETWSSAVHPDDWEKVQKALNDHFQGLAPEYEAEHRVRTKSGEWIWVLDRGRVFARDENGKPLRMVGTELDITERKQNEIEKQRLYEEARRAIKTREDILAIVSHDLKNPVAAMELVADVLDHLTPRDLSKIREVASKIRTGTGQMRSLIEDLLDFAKIQGGILAIDRYAENLSEIAIPILEILRIRATAKGQKMTVDIPATLPEVACDHHRIGQVFSNIIGNAIKFTPDGGSIRIQARKQDEMILVSVADTGPGIPPELLPRIFERFWQAERTRRAGSGLGLSIAKGIIDAGGGKIWAESRPGKGSTFHFTLPIATAETKRRPLESKDFIFEHTLDGVHVLLVDDSPDMLALLKHMLEKSGAEVTEADSVAQAVRQLKRKKPHVLLTDIEMTGGSGFDLIDQIHHLRPEEGGDVPIAALTAHDRAEELKKIEEAGFDLYISKPVDIGKTVAAVKKLATKYRFLH